MNEETNERSDFYSKQFLIFLKSVSPVLRELLALDSNLQYKYYHLKSNCNFHRETVEHLDGVYFRPDNHLLSKLRILQ